MCRFKEVCGSNHCAEYECECSNCDVEDCKWEDKKCMKKLATFEDAGVDPNKIKELQEQNRELIALVEKMYEVACYEDTYDVRQVYLEWYNKEKSKGISVEDIKVYPGGSLVTEYEDHPSIIKTIPSIRIRSVGKDGQEVNVTL